MDDRENEKMKLILEMLIFAGLVIYVRILYQRVEGNGYMGTALGFSCGMYFYMPLRLGEYFGLGRFKSVFITYIFLMLAALLGMAAKGVLIVLFLIPVVDIWYNVFKLTVKR